MPLEFTKFNHWTITAPFGQKDQAKWFYGELLGLTEVPLPKDLESVYELIWYKLFDYLIHIEFAKHFVRPDAHLHGVETPPHFAIEIKNIFAARKKLEAQGAQTRDAVPISDRDRFYLIDPFGNYIEIIELHKNQKKSAQK